MIKYPLYSAQCELTLEILLEGVKGEQM
jgi:hypothetical protein